MLTSVLSLQSLFQLPDVFSYVHEVIVVGIGMLRRIIIEIVNEQRINPVATCCLNSLSVIAQVGEKVLLQEMKTKGWKGGKLDVQFKRPYVIAEDMGKGRCRVQDDKRMF